MKFTFYSTPGHGYLRVPKSTFLKVGANPNKISSYSGHDEKTLYLEEDCDAGYFLDLLDEKNISYELVHSYKRRWSITHNYNPNLFDFKFKEGLKVKLCSDEIGTLEFIRGTKRVVRTVNGILYSIPKTNPFKYITEVF